MNTLLEIVKIIGPSFGFAFLLFCGFIWLMKFIIDKALKGGEHVDECAENLKRSAVANEEQVKELKRIADAVEKR
jgi:hypothetical protein